MNRIIRNAGLALAAAAIPFAAAAQPLEGRWTNPKRSVIVKVARCGDAYCGTVSWANESNRDKGATPGTRVLSDLRPAGEGVYKGRAFEPKRKMHGSATVKQIGRDVMVVKGCAIAGLFCKEQRWIRIS